MKLSLKSTREALLPDVESSELTSDNGGEKYLLDPYEEASEHYSTFF